MGKAAKVKDVPINVKSDDWISAEIKNCTGDVDGKNKVLVAGGKLTINFDVIVPGKSVGTGAQAESNLNYARDAVKPTLDAFKKLVSGHLSSGLAKIVELHQGGDSKGYSAASGILDKLNKFIKDSLDKVRPNMRSAMAKRLNVNSKELLTIGTCRFKEMKIEPGVFSDEVNLEDNSGDIRAALARKGWQYCGVVWSGTSAMVGVDKKKEFKEADLKLLKELLDEGSAKHATGRIKAESQTNVIFQFKKNEANLPAGIEKILRTALNVQTGKKMSGVKVEIKDKFDADNKKGDSK